MPHVITAHTINDAYKKAKRLINRKGVAVYNKRTNSLTLEVRDVAISFCWYSGLRYELPEKFKKLYLIERSVLINAAYDIIDELNRDPTSRRAYGFAVSDVEPPCVIALQGLVRNWALSLVGFARSSDVEMLSLDLYVLTDLANFIKNRLSYQTGHGTVTLFTASLHKYLEGESYGNRRRTLDRPGRAQN